MQARRWMLIAALMTMSLTAGAKIEHLLPTPQKVAKGSYPAVDLQGGIRFATPPKERVAKAFELLLGLTNTPTAGTVVTVNYVDSIEGAYDYRLEGYACEAYRLTVAEGITIDAVTDVGVIHAVQTLCQLAEGWDGGRRKVESCTITDWPAFKLRGYMHDVGRSYIPFDELKKQILLFARFKVNTFHFHLTENQAWRFEVKQYPALTSAASMVRFAGLYYSQEQCRELDELAHNCGITIIPEIDMPGHSDAFERAMGHPMQTAQGMTELKNILDEVAAVFVHAPYIHIGADETAITYPNFLSTITNHIHSLDKRVVVWNPASNLAITSTSGVDMTQMWSAAGKKVAGLPNIDCRYNYINHFDVFSDLAAIYRSNIYYAPRGDAELAGTISAVWNDRFIATSDGIMAQNNVYANVLASAERAWKGGGDAYIDEGGVVMPTAGRELDEFTDWERRFLFHKEHSLSSEPIPYVRQTNVRWLIVGPFPNGGNPDASLPPDTAGPAPQYRFGGATYTPTAAVGAAVYLRHTWGTLVPAFFKNPEPGTTAYAWTYVYSPTDQTAGALIEFQNYSRSEKDLTAPDGQWDRRGSRIWLNGTELTAPQWDNTGVSVTNETPLGNENFTARQPLRVDLKHGWNLVFMKLPYIDAPGVRLDKWMFTFVLTDTAGRAALDGIVYSPRRHAAPEGVPVVYTDSGRIVVSGAEGALVRLFDIEGRLVDAQRSTYGPLYFSPSHPGTYIVDLGDQKTRKVILTR